MYDYHTGLESALSCQFQNNNEDFCRIKELVNQAVKKSLTEHRQLLSLALLSVIDSCRRDPAKFSILYYNLPSTTSASTKTQLAEFGTTRPNNNLGLFTLTSRTINIEIPMMSLTGRF